MDIIFDHDAEHSISDDPKHSSNQWRNKGPADPAVRGGGGGGGGGGAILGGRQIVVWIWDNFENLTKVLAKLRILL